MFAAGVQPRADVHGLAVSFLELMSPVPANDEKLKALQLGSENMSEKAMLVLRLKTVPRHVYLQEISGHLKQHWFKGVDMNATIFGRVP